MHKTERTLSAISAVMLLIASWAYFAYVMGKAFATSKVSEELIFMMAFLCLGSWAGTRILKRVLQNKPNQTLEKEVHGGIGVSLSTSQYRSLKIIVIMCAFAVYLVVSPIFAGEFAYIFARQHMQTVAYLTLALLYAFGITIFALGLRRLLYTK